MMPETIHLFGLIALRALADYDPIEFKRTTDLSRRELDRRIDSLLSASVTSEGNADVDQIRRRLHELWSIETEAESQVEQNFLLRSLGKSSLEYALRLALEYSRTARARPRSEILSDKYSTDVADRSHPKSRERDLLRLGVMRLLRELPDYVPRFDYRVQGREIDCFLESVAPYQPVIFIEAKTSLSSLRQVKNASEQLKTVAASWGKGVLTVLLTANATMDVRHMWYEIYPGSYLLQYDPETNEFIAQDASSIVAAVHASENMSD